MPQASPIRLMSKLAPDAKTAMSSNTETAAETPHKKEKHQQEGSVTENFGQPGETNQVQFQRFAGEYQLALERREFRPLVIVQHG